MEGVDVGCAVGVREQPVDVADPAAVLRLAVHDEARAALGEALAQGARAVGGGVVRDQHLREVVQRHEQQGLVEIHGVGVGLDLSPSYGSSLVLDLAGAIRNGMFREVLETLAGRHRR